MSSGTEEFYKIWKKVYKIAFGFTLGQLTLFILLFIGTKIPILEVLIFAIWKLTSTVFWIYLVLAIPICLFDICVCFMGIVYCIQVRKTKLEYKLCYICIAGMTLNCLYPYLLFLLIASW